MEELGIGELNAANTNKQNQAIGGHHSAMCNNVLCEFRREVVLLQDVFEAHHGPMLNTHDVVLLERDVVHDALLQAELLLLQEGRNVGALAEVAGPKSRTVARHLT